MTKENKEQDERQSGNSSGPVTCRSPSVTLPLPRLCVRRPDLMLFFQWAVWHAASSSALSATSLVNSNKLSYLSALPPHRTHNPPWSSRLKLIFNFRRWTRVLFVANERTFTSAYFSKTFFTVTFGILDLHLVSQDVLFSFYPRLCVHHAALKWSITSCYSCVHWSIGHSDPTRNINAAGS